MRKLKMTAIAALFAAALSACGGGGGGEVPAEVPPPAPAPGPAPSPGPAPAPVPVPPPPPQPQAPSNILGSTALNVVTGETLIFNLENGSLVGVDDPDSPTLTTSLTLSGGTLTMAPDSGADIVGDGSDHVTVTGTIAQINAALNGMTFIALGLPRTVSLRIVTEDGTAPVPLSDDAQITINITGVPVPEFKTFQLASDVLGQPSLTQGSSGPASRTNLLAPRGAVAFSGGGAVYVPDAGHNRVLGFAPDSGAGAQADFVLGQAGFTQGGGVIDQGKHPQAAHVSIYPTGVGRMAVAEPSANRVSLYHTLPTSQATLPLSLFGQDNFTDSAPDCFPRRLNGPQSVSITPSGTRTIVADTGNHRVVVYDNFTPPGDLSLEFTRLLGQGLSNECNPNRGGLPNGGTMSQPTGVWTDGERVVVADTGNNRVLIWNTFPALLNPFTGEVEPAHLVLGQPNFSAVLPNQGFASPAAARMNAPTHVASDGTRLAVADTGNHRVLIWTTWPGADGALPQVVLGQGSFIKGLPNDSIPGGGSDGPSAAVFSSPTGLTFHNGKLYVTDRDNNRVLIFEPQ